MMCPANRPCARPDSLLIFFERRIFMNCLKLFAAAAVAVSGFTCLSQPARAAEGHAMTGVLIDNKCGEGKDEAAAAKHPIGCAKKEACAASGYQLVVGDK